MTVDPRHMDSEDTVYSIRQSDGISPIARHIIAVGRYYERGWPNPKELLYLIDLKLPNLAGERNQALAEVLARLEDMFEGREGWENEAKDYWQSDEGTTWMAQQFIRADELGSGGVRPSGSGDIERQTVNPDRNSVIQRLGDGTATLSQASSRISPMLETNSLEEILSSSPMAKVAVAGAAALAVVVVWHHYTRS